MEAVREDERLFRLNWAPKKRVHSHGLTMILLSPDRFRTVLKSRHSEGFGIQNNFDLDVKGSVSGILVALSWARLG